MLKRLMIDLKLENILIKLRIKRKAQILFFLMKTFMTIKKLNTFQGYNKKEKPI